MINLDNCKILVTGGCGFIGSNFIKLVLKIYKNVHIMNIDKMGIGSRTLELDNLGSNYVERQLDLTNFTIRNVIEIFPDNQPYDYVIHFAAESHVDRSITQSLGFIQNNVLATACLMEYVKKYCPSATVVVIGTDEVYGHLELNDPPFTENTILAPRSPYSSSKASSDLIALSYHATFGLDVIVTRCCNNYGPYQHSEKFIPTVIQSLNHGGKIPVYGKGENIREWIYVDDHNKSILDILNQYTPGTIYNIGSGVEKTNLEMISEILKFVQPDAKLEDVVKYVEDRKGHDFRYAISTLNYNRTFELTNFTDGLFKTVCFYT